MENLGNCSKYTGAYISYQYFFLIDSGSLILFLTRSNSDLCLGNMLWAHPFLIWNVVRSSQGLMLICKKLEQMTIHTHQYDIPEGLTFSGSVAVDTETMGLNPKRDRTTSVWRSISQTAVNWSKYHENFSFRTIWHRYTLWTSTYKMPTSILHQNSVKTGSHIHRSPRFARFMPGSSQDRTFKGTAKFGLGSESFDR